MYLTPQEQINQSKARIGDLVAKKSRLDAEAIVLGYMCADDLLEIPRENWINPLGEADYGIFCDTQIVYSEIDKELANIKKFEQYI